MVSPCLRSAKIEPISSTEFHLGMIFTDSSFLECSTVYNSGKITQLTIVYRHTPKSGPDVIFFGTNIFRSTSQSCGGQQWCRHCTQLHFGGDIQHDQEAARGILTNSTIKIFFRACLEIGHHKDLHLVSRHQQHHLDASFRF